MTHVNVFIKNELSMGHKNESDILHFVNEKYLEIDNNDNVYIKSNQHAKLKYNDGNNLYELIFSNNDSYDILIENESYNNYFEIV